MVGQVKKVWGDTFEGGDTRVKAIKSDSDSDSDEQKKSPAFSEKNKGVTPSVAAPDVTHPSDATVFYNNVRLSVQLTVSPVESLTVAYSRKLPYFQLFYR